MNKLQLILAIVAISGILHASGIPLDGCGNEISEKRIFNQMKYDPLQSKNLNFKKPQEKQAELPVIVKSFPTPTSSVGDLAYDGHYLWVLGFGEYRIFQISMVDGSINKTIPTNIYSPYGLTFDGHTLWVADNDNYIIQQIDTLNGTVLKSFSTPSITGYPHGLAWDGEDLWHNDSGGPGVAHTPDITFQIDINGSIVQEFSAKGDYPTGLTWDGRYLWTSDNGLCQIHQVDVSTFSIIRTIDAPGGAYPNGLAWDGQYIWVSNDYSDMIYQIDIGYQELADYQLFINPDTVHVVPGNIGSFQVSMDMLNGFSEKIGLSVSGLPSSVTYTFSPDSIDVLTTSTLNIQTTSSTSPGPYPFTVTGSRDTLLHSVDATLIVNWSDSVRIYPKTDTLDHYAGDEFWLDICVGDSVNEVNNLFGVSFGVVFDSDWSSPVSGRTMAGPFLGAPGELRIMPPVGLGDTLFTAVTRTDTNRVGVSDSGVILRIKFKIKEKTPDMPLCFDIIQAEARDPNWNSIYLIPDNQCIIVHGWIDVWPGDTDNNGKVNQADLLPIGLSWFAKGYARTDPDLTHWHVQKCHPWLKDIRYTYADANGDGIVDDLDILTITPNFHCVQGCSCSLSKISKSHEGTGKGGNVFIKRQKDEKDEGIETVDIFVEGVRNLFGVAVHFHFASGSFEVEGVERGELFQDAPVLFHQPLPEGKGYAVVVSRVRPEPGVSGSGCIGRVRIKNTAQNLTETISIDRIVGIDPLGKRIQFDIGLEQSEEQVELPEIYHLYQNYPNPFNTSTTIRYCLPRQTHVAIKVFDLLGAEVAMILNEEKDRGSYEVFWDGCNYFGEAVSSGVYFFNIEADGFKSTCKGLLLK